MVDASQIVPCPNCQTKIRIGNPGQTYRCPKCQNTLRAAPAAAKQKPVAAKTQLPAKTQTSTKPPSTSRAVAAAVPANDDLFGGGSFGSAPLSSGPAPMMAPQPSWAGATPATPNKSKAPAGKSKKTGILIAIGVGCAAILLVGGVFVALALLASKEKAPVAAVAVNNPPAPVAVEPVNAEPPPPATEENWVPSKSAPLIYNGETLGPQAEGSGKRVPLVGKGLQPNEVRTITWRIVQSGAMGSGDRLSAGESALKQLPGYVKGSLVINPPQNTVSLKYKGIELIGHEYRTPLELATELTLDPKPKFE